MLNQCSSELRTWWPALLLALCVQAQAQTASEEPAASEARLAPPTAAPLGITPPVGPPADPFVDESRRGYLLASGWRVIPALNLTYVSDSNPLMLYPSSGTDGIRALNLALTVKSATPGLFSGFFVTGTVHHDALQNQSEKPALAQLLYTPKVDDWTLPLTYVYSRNKLSRSSLLSQNSNVPPVSAQDTVLNQFTADAIRQFGSTGLSVGVTWADVQIGSSLLANGQTLNSSSSYTTQTERAKITRPAGTYAQWFVRGQADEYRYGSGSQTQVGSRKSNLWTWAGGLQGMLAQGLSYTGEVGRARKTSTSDQVPGSTSTVAALNFMWNPDASTNAVFGVNRSVFETNLPSISNVVANSPFAMVSRRISPSLIVQANATLSHIQAVPVSADLTDKSGTLTLLWKPHPALLFAASVGRTLRGISPPVAAAGLNPFSQTKYLVNMTWYP